MTKFSLPKSESLILVNAELTGPTGSIFVTLALDTGCTRTVIQPGYLRAIGYVPERDGKPLQVLTASKLEKAYSLKVKGFSALGRVVSDLAITAQPLPPAFQIDGLLGLNFFKKLKGRLIIDFGSEEISL